MTGAPEQAAQILRERAPTPWPSSASTRRQPLAAQLRHAEQHDDTA